MADGKKDIVTPVFKKGDKTEFDNYRPVTCLPAAAKLLEMVTCLNPTNYSPNSLKTIKRSTPTTRMDTVQTR